MRGATSKASFSQRVDGGVKTIYSPPLRSIEPLFLQRLHRENQARRQNNPTHQGSGRVRPCHGDGVRGHVQRSRASVLPNKLSEAWSGRGSVASGRGRRIGARPPSSASLQARIPQGSGPFCFLFGSTQPSRASAQDSDRWIASPENGESSLTTCRKTTLGTGRGHVLQICGCSSAGRARPRHGRGHEFEARHPLHFGCAHALRCRAIWCWRPGCARPWPGHVQRDTASDGTLARGHSRSGFTTASVAQLAEQPPCKWQVARSIRRRRHQIDRSRSSSWPRTPGFQSGYAGSTPARDARTGTLVELALRGWKSAATIGPAPEPVPGWISWGV